MLPAPLTRGLPRLPNRSLPALLSCVLGLLGCEPGSSGPPADVRPTNRDTPPTPTALTDDAAGPVAMSDQDRLAPTTSVAGHAGPQPTVSLAVRRVADAGVSPFDGGARKGAVVAVIGDSFVHAHFSQTLSEKLKPDGAYLWVVAKTSAYTVSLANDPEVDNVFGMRPKLAIIVLGANEFDIKKPEAHEWAVKTLVKKASRAPSCVWVTPPSFRKDTGILSMIRRNVAPCRYFDSDAHVPRVERQPDGIHPNKVGGTRWAEAFWAWAIQEHDPGRGPFGLRDESMGSDAGADH